MSIQNEPLIPHTQSVPEITLKAVIIAIILTVVLTAANAYLGLKVGQTISASIPAAVISMAVLRMFRRHNVLEINIIQTAASAGEALVAGILFTLPGLLVIHFWFNFNYGYTFLIALIGGVLGVLFSVPLRRILLADKSLRFPEGTAIGNVMRASASKSGASLKYLVQGGLFAGFIGFAQTGLRVLSDSMSLWFSKGPVLFGLGLGFSPAVVAAGYIVGINVALAFLVGVVVVWLIGIPLLSLHFGYDHTLSVADAVMTLWSHYIRYIGVGTMLVGGVWTILTLLKPIARGLKLSLESLHTRRSAGGGLIRTERDLPINYAGWLVLLCMVPLCFMLLNFISPASLGIGNSLYTIVIIVALIFAILVGFMAASIGGYFAGLVGSSNSPVSGLAIIACLLMAIILYAVLSTEVHFSSALDKAAMATALVIILTAIIASSAAISIDTIQDLKAGQMVGATPWKQQFMLLIGVAAAALVIPLLLQLLFNAYGIAGVYPRPNMDPTQMLAAPQAALIAAVARGMFGPGLPWGMISIGVIIGAVCIIIDEYCKTKNTRLPVLAVGLGIYLPMSVTAPMIAGGFMSYFVQRHLKRQQIKNPQGGEERTNQAIQRTTLLACGMVAGASLVGVILAIPFAIFKSSDILVIMPHSLDGLAGALGLISIIILCAWLYRTGCNKKLNN